ncbi:hypothetical protein HYN48_09940 [Flavobacterium magnum]|uniref:Secretion system C-terminal sorting domain-containing protein n=1 Tax=Flavobacterium magnum TaxID=2162713 RepID=A0A2S0RF44_9FLAO|nr:T9SS type A sorting domain-containing protein [Flavobacterium magnum]AWA30383.1 hypothetical protein HYN48_09940 [Flavobacterium magnum]
MQKFILIFLLGFSICNAQVSFAPYISIPTGSWPEVVCVGDVNNDGRSDVVLGMASYFDTNNDYRIFIFTQDNSGELNPAVKYPYTATSSDIETLDIADVDNDGLNDVVIGFGTKIGIFYQNDSGTLNPITEIVMPNLVKSLKVGDLNNDGLNDIAIAYYANNVATLMQSAGGAFTTASYTCTTAYDAEIHIADLNGDGRQDVVTKSSDQIHVLTQNLSGILDTEAAYAIGSSIWGINGIAVGDLDNDGKSDVAASGGGNSPASKLYIWKQNQTTHLLDSPSIISSYDVPEPIEIGDLNNDGKNEIFEVHGGGSLSCYEQNASGQYTSYDSFPLPYATHYNRQGFALGDFNNDGLKDVAVADYNHGLVLLYNTSVSLSVNPVSKIATVNVYPNPFTDFVNVDFVDNREAGSEILLFDSLGSQILREANPAAANNIDLRNYSSGIYYLKVSGPKGELTKKIIKK